MGRAPSAQVEPDGRIERSATNVRLAEAAGTLFGDLQTISRNSTFRLEPLPFAFAHGSGSSSLFLRASPPVRVFRRKRDLL